MDSKDGFTKVEKKKNKTLIFLKIQGEPQKIKTEAVFTKIKNEPQIKY